MGSTNASVLPVPVAAEPTTSLPCSAGGMACAWMGVGASKPSRSRATRHFFDKPRAANVIADLLRRPGLFADLLQERLRAAAVRSLGVDYRLQQPRRVQLG